MNTNFVFVYVTSPLHRWTAYFADKTIQQINNFTTWFNDLPDDIIVLIVKDFEVECQSQKDLITKVQSKKYNKNEFQQLYDATIKHGSYTKMIKEVKNV